MRWRSSQAAHIAGPHGNFLSFADKPCSTDRSASTRPGCGGETATVMANRARRYWMKNNIRMISMGDVSRTSSPSIRPLRKGEIVCLTPTGSFKGAKEHAAFFQDSKEACAFP